MSIKTYVDSIPLGILPADNYTAIVIVYLYVVTAASGTNNPVASTRTFTVLAGCSLAKIGLPFYTIAHSHFKQSIKIDGPRAGVCYGMMALDGKVLEGQVLENGEIKTADLAEGIYFLELKSAQGLYRQKMLKMP